MKAFPSLAHINSKKWYRQGLPLQVWRSDVEVVIDQFGTRETVTFLTRLQARYNDVNRGNDARNRVRIRARKLFPHTEVACVVRHEFIGAIENESDFRCERS